MPKFWSSCGPGFSTLLALILRRTIVRCRVRVVVLCRECTTWQDETTLHWFRESSVQSEERVFSRKPSCQTASVSPTERTAPYRSVPPADAEELPMPPSREVEIPVEISGHLHVGCFHALLDILLGPLASFVATRRASGPPLSAKAKKMYGNLDKAGFKSHAQFIKNHWSSHFGSTTAPAVLDDVKLVLSSLIEGYYVAHVPKKCVSACMEAILRLMSAVGCSDEVLRRAQAVLNILKPGCGSVVRIKADKGTAGSIFEKASPPKKEDGLKFTKSGTSCKPATIPHGQKQGKLSHKPSKPNSTAPKTHPDVRPFKKLMKKAGQAIKAANYAQATAYYSQAIDLLLKSTSSFNVHPVLKATAYTNRARCFLQLGKYDVALEDIRASYVYSIDWYPGYEMECHALVKLERSLEAIDVCRNLVLKHPHSEELKNLQLKMQNIHVAREANEGSFQGASSIEEFNSSAVQTAALHTSISHGQSVEKTIRLSSVVIRAAGTSTVADRCLRAEELLTLAEKALSQSDLKDAFHSLRSAFSLWPQLLVPPATRDDLLVVGVHDAVAWGGPYVYYSMLAQKTSFLSIQAECEFWAARVERFSGDAGLHAQLADALFRANDLSGSLTHIEKALGLQTDAFGNLSWLYMRARCVTDNSRSAWLPRFFANIPSQRLEREREMLNYIQLCSMDEEWMSHACYSLGLAYLARADYTRAKQFHYLAEAAETRHRELGIFPVIDENEFTDKKMLDAAFNGGLMVMPKSEQRLALAATIGDGGLRCGWCRMSWPTVAAFAQHKSTECPACIPFGVS